MEMLQAVKLERKSSNRPIISMRSMCIQPYFQVVSIGILDLYITPIQIKAKSDLLT